MIQQPPNQADLALTHDEERDQYVLHVHDGLGGHHQAIVDDATVEALSARALALRHGIGDKPTLEYDDLTARLIGAHHEVMAQEPPEPNGNMPQALQDQVAQAHLEWDRKRAAYRLLVATRLASAALDD